MPRILFYDDYSEGAHPEILAALQAGNDGQQVGYGDDDYCKKAAELIAGELGADADVHFVSGGTQANIVCLAAMLRPFEGVIAAGTSHIEVHETGAIEATGHKVITVESNDGKLTPSLIDTACATHQDEHTVKPRVVFLSQATELGTVYSLDELSALSAHAHQRGLYVYLDGARLAMACAALDPPANLAEIAACGIDVLYVGGTKNGGLFGEAVAILNKELREDFRYTLKQRGALLAKGRALGLQFQRFFRDGLWYDLGKVANQRAARMAEGLRRGGVSLYVDQVVNQVFPILPPDILDGLGQQFGFHRWATVDAGVVIRLVCSWATADESVDQLVSAVGSLIA